MPHTTVTDFGHEFVIHGLEPDEHIFRYISRQGSLYERELLEALTYVPLKPGVAVDVGANIGNHTVFFAAVLGRDVVAVEAEEANFAVLERTIDANGMGSRVHAHRRALASHSGRGRMVQRHAGNAGSFHIVDDPDGSVEVCRLDDLLTSNTRVALVKVDVEGGEVAVLEGATGVLERDAPVVTAEAHSGADLWEIIGRLAPYDYRPVHIAGHSDNYVFAAPASLATGTPEDVAAVMSMRATRLANGRLQSLAGRGMQQQEAVLRTVRDLDAAIGPNSAAERARWIDTEREARAAAAQRDLLSAEVDRLRRDNRRLDFAVDRWRRAYENLSRSRVLRLADRARSVGGGRPVRLDAVEQAVRIDQAARQRYPD